MPEPTDPTTRSGEGAPAPDEPGADAVRPEETESGAQAEAAVAPGPPRHWLEYIKQRAPHLLSADGGLGPGWWSHRLGQASRGDEAPHARSTETAEARIVPSKRLAAPEESQPPHAEPSRRRDETVAAPPRPPSKPVTILASPRPAADTAQPRDVGRTRRVPPLPRSGTSARPAAVADSNRPLRTTQRVPARTPPPRPRIYADVGARPRDVESAPRSIAVPTSPPRWPTSLAWTSSQDRDVVRVGTAWPELFDLPTSRAAGHAPRTRDPELVRPRPPISRDRVTPPAPWPSLLAADDDDPEPLYASERGRARAERIAREQAGR